MSVAYKANKNKKCYRIIPFLDESCTITTKGHSVVTVYVVHFTPDNLHGKAERKLTTLKLFQISEV